MFSSLPSPPLLYLIVGYGFEELRVIKKYPATTVQGTSGSESAREGGGWWSIRRGGATRWRMAPDSNEETKKIANEE